MASDTTFYIAYDQNLFKQCYFYKYVSSPEQEGWRETVYESMYKKRRSGFKLKKRKFRLDIRKNI